MPEEQDKKVEDFFNKLIEALAKSDDEEVKEGLHDVLVAMKEDMTTNYDYDMSDRVMASFNEMTDAIDKYVDDDSPEEEDDETPAAETEEDEDDETDIEGEEEIEEEDDDEEDAGVPKEV
jgi:hypothetical protein